MNGDLSIESGFDPSLTPSIEGIAGIDLSQTNSLSIRGFPNVNFCSFPNICEYLTAGGKVSFGAEGDPYDSYYTNGQGCNSVQEVLANCNLSPVRVHFKTFYDNNQNGIQDSDDFLIGNFPIRIQEFDRIAFTSEDEVNSLILAEGVYNFEALPQIGWDFTSPNALQRLLRPNQNPDTLCFGIFPDFSFSEIIPSINLGRFRCNEDAITSISIRNSGATIANGELWFEFDDLISSIRFIDQPDSIEGNRIMWRFSDLLPNQSLIKKIGLLIPGPPDVALGEPLQFNSFVNFEDQNGQHTSDIFELQTEVRCSYDPNDKLVNPDRDIEVSEPPNVLNLTLFDEPLIYTIRFQNTGNDYARNVVIRDTLDQNLNVDSFLIIGSSHSEVLTTSISGGRFIEFAFNEIFLPDSTADFQGSQGFVTFHIVANQGLAEETLITNTASIFFDLNPPIVTNTTENVLVSQFPTSSTRNNTNQLKINLYPNPTDGKIYLQGKDLSKAKISVSDLTGRIILIEKLNGTNEIQLPHNTSGLLLLKIETAEGVAVKRVFKN